jgi:hypothetical protein
MSAKIKSKDLSYDASPPPFLQRLRAQHSGYGPDKDPDRHERQLARPTKAKNTDDDDGPTVVDESGESISKEEWKRMNELEGRESADEKVDGEHDANAVAAAAAEESKRAERNVTDGAAVKKRKLGKVIGDEENAVENAKPANEKVVKKAKKKAKPIKLAFEDD